MLVDEQEVIFLVSFLENRIIRDRPIDARSGLEGAPRPEWHSNFETYLRELECPFLATDGASYSREDVSKYLSWLVQYSLGISYDDNPEEHNKRAEIEIAQVENDESERINEVIDANTASKIEELAKLCRVDTSGKDHFEIIHACHLFIKNRLLLTVQYGGGVTNDDYVPSTKATKLPTGKLETPKYPPGQRRQRLLQGKPSSLVPFNSMDVEMFPPGIHSGMSALDKGATILRLLYLTDLSHIQDGINELLVIAQEFTADPKTDSSLGVVGR